jgi:hypothetical protein
VRPEILRLLELGPLPNFDGVDVITAPEASVERLVAEMAAYEEPLLAIEAPVSDDEARALVSLLPAAGVRCLDYETTIMHLVETAPGWPIWDVLGERGDTIRRMRARLENAGLAGPA